MLKVGLTGGLASGKTFVANALAEMGCLVVQADELGHQVLMPQGEAYGPVVEHFGRSILDRDGLIDRKRLAAEVFQDSAKLEWLNGVVHPAVRRLEHLKMDEAGLADPHAIVVVEAAILIETGFYKDYDVIALVVCDAAQQMERALARPGATRADVEARLSRQWPLDEKRKYAHFVIDSSGAKADTIRAARELYARLRELEAQ